MDENYFKTINDVSELFITEIRSFTKQCYHLIEQEKNKNIDEYKINKTNQNKNITTDENEEELKRKEGIYDRIYETYRRCEEIIKYQQKIESLFQSFQTITRDCFERCQHRKEEISNTLNELLDTLKEDESDVKDDELTNEYEKINYKSFYIPTKQYQLKIENEKQQEKEAHNERRHQFVNTFLSKHEMKLLEQHIGRYIDSCLFDSNKNQWNIDDSEFYQKIENESEVLIVIETISNRKLGCYITQQINCNNVYISDPNAFVFCFENDSLQTYPISQSNYSIKICEERSENLFIVGFSFMLFDIFGDITVKKYQQKSFCNCSQTSYNYNRKQNALLGRKGPFEIKQFCVLKTITANEEKNKQLLFSTSMKQEQHQMKMMTKQKRKMNIHRQNNFEEMKMKWIKELNQLEKWIGLQFQEVIFDSHLDNWSEKTSVFNDCIKNKSQLGFIIVDENDEIFGYYLNSTIEFTNFLECNSTDEKSFEFNLKSNGRFKESMKFEIKDTSYGYWLYDNSDYRLISLGDITIEKNHLKNKSFCSENHLRYNYKNISKAICGNKYFIPKRIIVVLFN